jgi:hypothetical protein
VADGGLEAGSEHAQVFGLRGLEIFLACCMTWRNVSTSSMVSLRTVLLPNALVAYPMLGLYEAMVLPLGRRNESSHRSDQVSNRRAAANRFAGATGHNFRECRRNAAKRPVAGGIGPPA